MMNELLKEFNPNRGQAKFIALWLSKKFPVVSMCGGWGVGKTRLIAMLCHLNHIDDPSVNGFVLTDSMGRGARTVGVEMAQLLEPLGWTFHNAIKGTPAPHWRSPVRNGHITTVWVLSWKRPSGKSKAANSLEGPDCGWGCLDESQVVDAEVGTAMLGRVRSGNPGRLCLIGKPTGGMPWWVRFAEERGGVGFFCPSTVNKPNLPRFNEWLSSLSRREVLENIYCVPQPPEGAVFDMWSPEVAPKGNILPPSWKPEPWMRTVVSFDFGVRFPSALVISHDSRLNDGEGADVIWAEANPDRASVFDVCKMLRRGNPSFDIPGIYPASRAHEMPEDSIPVSAAYGDRSGRNMRDDQNMTSAIGDVMTVPAVGGLGLKVIFTDDPGRIDINAGIRQLWRLMEDNTGKRRLFCSHQLWSYGTQVGGRSFAKSITNYSWSTGSRDVPKKDGVNDHACDALRYWAINARWKTSTAAKAARGAFKTGAQLRTTTQPAFWGR